MTYTIIKTKDGAAVVEWIEKPGLLSITASRLNTNRNVDIMVEWENRLAAQPQIPVHPKDVQYFLDNWLYKEMPEGIWCEQEGSMDEIIGFQESGLIPIYGRKKHATRKEQTTTVGDTIRNQIILFDEWRNRGDYRKSEKWNKLIVSKEVDEITIGMLYDIFLEETGAKLEQPQEGDVKDADFIRGFIAGICQIIRYDAVPRMDKASIAAWYSLGINFDDLEKYEVSSFDIELLINFKDNLTKK